MVFSGDQQVFSSWDSAIKLAGYRNSGGIGHVIHHFHLADGFGKSASGQVEPHITNESYRYENGRETQPAWFAITEMWPVFPVLSTVPYMLGRVLGEKFDEFAEGFEATQAELDPIQSESVSRVMGELGFGTNVPQSANETYELLTSSTSYGIADGKDTSGSAYNFADIEDLQRQSMVRLYKQTAALVPPDVRPEVRKRFEEITDENGDLFQILKDQPFPSLAKNAYSFAAQRLHEMTGVDIRDVQLEDTTSYFQLVDRNGETSENADAFTFLNWYIANQDVYNKAHNEISEEISQRGGNPIQTISSHKGETPFWVIIDGQKHKLFMHENAIGIVKREQGAISEVNIPTTSPITSHEDIAELLAQSFEGRAVTVIPTALGLALQLRASGTLLLPDMVRVTFHN